MPVLGDVMSCPKPQLRNAVSIPTVASLVKDSWSWAGDTINTHRDGLTKEQRQARTKIEDRKQILYLRMKNVSSSYAALSKHF